MTIGKLAAAQGVSVETIRFYERRGLLAQPERGAAGFRLYSDADQWRLAFIRRAKLLGFTLGEIADLLGPARATEDITAAAQAKLTAVSAQIADLAQLQCRLRRLVSVCERGDRADCLALHLPELATS